MDRPQGRSQRPGGERRLGRYELVSPVAETALGALFHGRVALGAEKGRDVLVRRVPKGKAIDDATLHAIREAAAEVGKVRHPSVTGILEVRLGTSLVVATEHAEGVPLRSVMNAARKRGSRLASAVSSRIVVELLRTMTDASAALEAAGVVRPLLGVCPDAVLVGEGGSVMVSDLALLTLARPPRHPELMAYRAPEQLGALAEGDSRSELFSVGVMWWELLANRSLFGGDSQAAVWQRVRQGSIPPPPKVEDDVRALVMTLLDRNPSARLRDVDEVMSVIRELGAAHIADWDATSHALDELANLVERGDFPSVAPPPDLRSLPPRWARSAPRAAGAKAGPEPSAVASSSAAKPQRETSLGPGAPAGRSAPKPAHRPPAKREASQSLAKSVRPVPRPPGGKTSGAPPPRPSSPSSLAAVRPSSFAPAPLPRDIPDEEDWGADAELPEQDLVTLRPDPPNGVSALPDVELASLQPREASRPTRMEAGTRKGVATPTVTGDEPPTNAAHPVPPRPPEIPRVARSPGVALLGPLPVSQRATKPIAINALTQAVDEPAEPEPSTGLAVKKAAALPAAEEPSAEEPALEAEPSEEPGPAGEHPTSPNADAAPLPAFATDDERPVEETLGEVLRDAARPFMDAAVDAGEESMAPVHPEAPAVRRDEPPAVPRSPMVSSNDESERVSTIERMAAAVREERPPAAMPGYDEGRTDATSEKSSVWPTRFFVGGVFAVTSIAVFFGWRAVLLAPGPRVVVPPPSAAAPVRTVGSTVPVEAPSSVPSVEPVVSAAPSTSAELAAPTPPAEPPAPDPSPAPAQSQEAPPLPPKPLATEVSPGRGEPPPEVEPAAPEEAPVQPPEPPATDSVTPADDPYG